MDFLSRLAGWLDRPGFPWKSLIISFSLGEYLLENWLALRQYRVLQGTKVPKQLQNEVDQATFDKSQVCSCILHLHLCPSNHPILGIWSRKSQVWLRFWCHLSAQVSRRHPLRFLSQILGSYRSCPYSLPSCKLSRRNRSLAALRLRLILHRDSPESATLILPPLCP
jgi:hypothetical protein